MTRRTLEQNSKMWAMLTDIANTVEWPVDGRLQLLSPEDWKTILTAGLRKVQRIAQGVEGGFVILGASTSRMSQREMSELIDFIEYFGGQHQVKWTLDTTLNPV